jgi:hypothetical protein
MRGDVMSRPIVMCSVVILIALGSFGDGGPGGSCAVSEFAADPATTWRGDLETLSFEPDPLAEPSKAAAVAEYITREQLEEDLDQFQTELEERFAYLRYNEPDYRSAIQAIRENAGDGMSVSAFDIELTKVMGLFIDCHAIIAYGSRPEGYLPFRMEAIGNRIIAFWPDRRDFVSTSHPFITKIDGRSMHEWESALDVILPEGSPQYVTHGTLRWLEEIRYARLVTGSDDPDTIEIELESRDRSERVTVAMEISDDRPGVERWPASESGFLDGNIGYLRITGWDEDAFEEVAMWMPRFGGTRGLIVDIRNNYGGTRSVLRDLYPYFVSASDSPHVANAAKYRLYSGFGYNHLAGRNMYRESWNGWSSAERTAISEFMETFEPEWVVPESEFSDWHFWVLSKSLKPDAYDPPGQIVFLMDHKCASASDVILSAVKGVPNVTLIGESSMGASGARIITTLRNSGLDLYLSSMASFQNTGLLFDSNGVDPDFVIEPEPEYYLRNGPDKVLDAALRRFEYPHRSPRRLSRNVR